MENMNDHFRSAMVMESMALLNLFFASVFGLFFAFSFLSNGLEKLYFNWPILSSFSFLKSEYGKSYLLLVLAVCAFIFVCAFFFFEDRSSKNKSSLRNQNNFAHVMVAKKYRNWFASINILMAITGLSLGVFLKLRFQENLNDLQQISLLMAPIAISLLAIALLISVVEVRDEKIVIPRPFLFSGILLSAVTILTGIVWGSFNTDIFRLITIAAPMLSMDLIILNIPEKEPL